MLPTPNLDDRSFEQIRDEALRLIPQYCPEWTNFNPSDPGVTLIELFAWMTEMVLYRLNRVPDKVYLTLLDLIGVRLMPPQPARTMLSFQLVEGFAGGTWVPRGTQIATQPDEDGEAIVFETERDLYAVSTRLIRCFSIHRDKVSDNSARLRGATRGAEPGPRPSDGAAARGAFEAFAGAIDVERSLYLSDPRLLTLKESGTLQLVFECPQARTEGLTALLEWEYWNGHRWRELDPVELPPEEEATSGPTQRAVGFAGPLEDLAEDGEVEGVVGPWIRGRLVELPQSDDETVLGRVTAAAQILTQGVLPELGMSHLAGDVFVPADLTKTFHPFGEQPHTENCFYVASDECLGKRDARVFLDFVAADPTLVPPAQPTPTLELTLEYWNGQRWAGLGQTTPQGPPPDQGHEFRDGTLGLRQSGTISFLRPAELHPCPVNGVEGCWVRLRISRGDYGKPGAYEVRDGNWVWREDHPLRPPAFRSLQLRYSQVPFPVARCFTYNDFTFADKSELVRDPFRTFQAFEPFKEEHPALYLGFDGPLPDQPIQLFVRVEELPEERDEVVLGEPFPEEVSERERRRRRRKDDQRLVWEYWNGARWTDLKPRDETQNLTRSGTLEFRGPPGQPRREFGEELHWLRCRMELGSYARSPRIEDLLLNTVGAQNASEVRQESLGHSDGTPDQRHAFARFPVLPGERIVIREPELPGKRETRRILAEEGEDAIRHEQGQVWVRWHRVESFYASGPTDRHYVIDPVAGQLVFGDGRRGMIPPPGPNAIVAERYLTGGGLVGNVGAGALTVLRQAVPYVERVTNHWPARGGADLETLEDAKLRGPQVVRHRYRAVTIEDYEWLARRASPNVARSRCLKTPRKEGEVTVLVLPRGEQREVDLEKKPVPAPELLRRVQDFLDERRLVTTRVKVQKPRWVEVSVRVRVVSKAGGPGADRLKRDLEQAIRQALHPLFGGPDGGGWPFGRTVHKSDLYRVLEGLVGVDFVEDLELFDEDLKRSAVQIDLREDQLVHVVDVDVRVASPEVMR